MLESFQNNHNAPVEIESVYGQNFSSLPTFGQPVSTKVPATCGELAQGYLGGKDFLINSPISLHAEVSLQLNRIGSICIFSHGNFSKMSSAVSETLRQLNNSHLGAEIQVNGSIPRGKGLASSTAEVAAAIISARTSLGYRSSPKRISEVVTKFDSTDGTYFPGISMLNQVTGEYYQAIGTPPPLAFIICDTGGQIESHEFDRAKARRHASSHPNCLREAIKLIKDGVRLHEPRLIADGATISAKINQGILYKQQFTDLLKLAKDAGALGVNCAHTGTILGVMYDPRHDIQDKLIQRIEAEFGEDFIIGCHQLVSGGVI